MEAGSKPGAGTPGKLWSALCNINDFVGEQTLDFLTLPPGSFATAAEVAKI